jgi:hypothetical protein
VGAVARRSQGRCSTRERERENDGSESDGNEMKKMRGMGSTPPRLTLFIEGSTKSIRCGSLLRTTHPNGSIPRSSREDRGEFFANRPIFQPNRKITSGHPDGKHDLQAPTSYKSRSLANHFCQIDQVHDRRERTLHGPFDDTNRLRPYWIQNPRGCIDLQPYRIQNPRVHATYDLTGSRIRRYTSRLRPHWVQNPAHKINILQGLSYLERSLRPTLPK